MILLFGIILVYRELNKGKPVQIEKKNMIGKIVYETFNGKSKPSLLEESFKSNILEGFQSTKEKHLKNKSKEFFTNREGMKESMEHDSECKPLPKGPEGGKSLKFCQQYNNEDHMCLHKRCEDLGANCKKAPCCLDND